MKIWEVKTASESNPDKFYTVTLSDSGRFTCSCPDHFYRQRMCKHIEREYKRHFALITKLKSRVTHFERKSVAQLLKVLRIQTGVQLIPAGSFRREIQEVQDLDVLAQDIHRQYVKEAMIAFYPNGKEQIAKADGDHNLRWRVPLGQNEIMLDFYFAPQIELQSQLLWLTGSKHTNISMRVQAKGLGFKLNRHGLWNRDKTRLIAANEKEIFRKLEMEYVEPHLR